MLKKETNSAYQLEQHVVLETFCSMCDFRVIVLDCNCNNCNVYEGTLYQLEALLMLWVPSLQLRPRDSTGQDALTWLVVAVRCEEEDGY